MRLRFDGLKPYVIAVDGQPTDTFEPLQASLPFAPGTRYDLLVDLPAEAGTKGAVTALIGDGMPLVELVADRREARRPAADRAARAQQEAAGRRSSCRMPRARTWSSRRRQGRRRPPGRSTARPGDRARAPLLKVKRGTPRGAGARSTRPSLVQPMHLHGHVFRLLHPLDDGWEPYFLDTVQVPENRTAPDRLRGRQSGQVAPGLHRHGAVRRRIVDLDRGHLSSVAEHPGQQIRPDPRRSGPGPKLAPASAWIQTPAQAASKAGSPCAIRPAMMPHRVSPEPAVREIGRAVLVDGRPAVRARRSPCRAPSGPRPRPCRRRPGAPARLSTADQGYPGGP